MARNFAKKNKAPVDTSNYSAVGKLVYWVNPPVSAGVLVGVLATLISLSWFSSISLLSNLLLLLVLGGVGSKIYVHLMGMLKKPCKDPLAQLAVVDVSVSEECVAELLKSTAETLNNTTSELRRLLLAESLYDSMKFGLVLYLLTFVGAIFNTLTLVIIGCVFAFILPKICEDNQDSVDDIV
ncbi:reticulon-2 [Eurytemora carolleeae]|uniref:reticulon-2 n=1 Tax=Eurytemora carolleeae TaxID=1294199 RepID=UPI000C77888C|nr:reticulon-2 [Eurytemora carolleeae]|eukprot:XP_023339588.1 reticulon-2-like [Eurytemora affinis]